MTQLDRIEKLINTCVEGTTKCLAYIEQIANQHELIRQEHVLHHPESNIIVPIQMIRDRQDVDWKV